MRKFALALFTFLALDAWNSNVLAQQWTDNTFGDVHLDPALPPASVTIGDGSVVNTATLSVRGDQLPVADPFFGLPRLCTFRTDVAAVTEQSWWMYRDNNHIGRIWHDAGARAFHFQNMEPVDVAQDRFSGAMIQNNDADGLWIPANGLPEGDARRFSNPARLLNRVGYAALGRNEEWLGVPLATDIRGPWSRLHLFHNVMGDRPYFGFRSQMRNGITLTGNSDLAYMGQWFDHGTTGEGSEVADKSNVVFGLGENVLPAGLSHHWDNFSFRFFGDMSLTDGAASGLEGLEMMRIRPFRAQADAPVQGFVGIGDFLSAATGPEERLDILTGRLRIRELPLAANENANLARYLVTDDNGVIHWRNVPGGGGGGGCEWDQVSGSNNLRTAWSGAASGCPGADSHVSIGTTSVAGKLTLLENGSTGSGETAFHVTMNGNTGNNTGMYLRVNDANGGSESNNGFDVEVSNGANYVRGMSLRTLLDNGRSAAEDVLGVEISTVMNGSCGQALGSFARVDLGANSVSTNAFGAYGRVRNMAASGGDSSNVQYMYGSYGYVLGVYDQARYGVFGQAANAPRSWAGYFAGKVYAQNAYFSSDAQLKTNIEELTNCTDVIAQLRPRKYNFNVEQWPSMGLPQGLQTGLVAQDLQEVVPHLVEMSHHPAQYDDDGGLVSEGVDFLSVNYIGLMPYMIGAIQEQQRHLTAEQATNTALTDRLAEQEALMAEQSRRLDQLEAALASCCANPANGDTRLLNTPPANAPDDLNKALEGDARHLHIQPNPFTERTTLHYRLERAGRVQLLANSADGKSLKVLQDAALESGAYQFNWETGELTPGVYYVTLLLDGEPLVKKAVKVMR